MLLKQKLIKFSCQFLKDFLKKKLRKGLLKAIQSLEKMPKRCALARENQHFRQEIRQLLYGKGRNTYRIIFTVIENQDSPFVRILHVRHDVK